METRDEAPSEAVAKERVLLARAKGLGLGGRLRIYARLSGPGWLQSAITLGGGSLGGALFLGVIGGTHMLWLQPLAMLAGVVMLSAISYVALSTPETPFRAMNRHLSPVLGWGWAIATLMANVVWCLPQFSLGVSAVRQNLAPNLPLPATSLGNFAVGLVLLAIAVSVIWSYGTGAKGVRVFEWLLKGLVALIILSFVGVVLRLLTAGGMDFGAILSGYIPRPSMLFNPSPDFAPVLAQIEEPWREYWSSRILRDQRDIMISAAAVAVGINMTFLLPYSMLAKGWNKDYRGLARFDLSTGLLIPFILVTSCIVVASAAQFHAQPARGLFIDEAAAVVSPEANPRDVAAFESGMRARVLREMGDAATGLEGGELAEEIARRALDLPPAERRIAAMLVRRDAFNLAEALEPLTGPVFARYVFGVGVVGMALSTIIILMLINGFVVCEMLGVPSRGWPHRLGCMIPAVGVLAPFVWGTDQAQFWLVVPTSVFGMALLPIAYFSFLLLMNSRAVLGDAMPRGASRACWNTFMGLSAGLATLGAFWSLWSRAGWIGFGLVAALVLVAIASSPLLRAGKRGAP